MISDHVETEQEYKLLFNIAKVWIEGASEEGSITPLQCSDLFTNLLAIDNRSKEISNHNFMNCLTLGKRTTSSNECRHKNMKYGKK